MLEVYCDGAASNNGNAEKRIGGWAYVVLDSDNEKILKENFGAMRHMTNQWGEMTAMLEACQAAKKFLEYQPGFCFHEVNIHSDSAYCINCYQQKWWQKWMANGWVNSKKEPVANRELWEKLIPFFEDPNFNFIKVKGHSTDKWNNYVDEMAVKARKNLE